MTMELLVLQDAATHFSRLIPHEEYIEQTLIQNGGIESPLRYLYYEDIYNVSTRVEGKLIKTPYLDIISEDGYHPMFYHYKIIQGKELLTNFCNYIIPKAKAKGQMYSLIQNLTQITSLNFR